MIFKVIMGQQIKGLDLYEMFIYKHNFKFEKLAMTIERFNTLLCDTCHTKLKKEFWSAYNISIKDLTEEGFTGTKFFCSKDCYKIHKLKE